MLNLNHPESLKDVPVPVWKVLIYDRLGQDIISPLISIRELRDLGITLHMLVTVASTVSTVKRKLNRKGQKFLSSRFQSCILINNKFVIFCGWWRFRQLHADRDSIPEVPAIYFCAPTDENIGRIGQDLQNGLYDMYHMNFISPISRQKMEDLASAALMAGAVANIHKVRLTSHCVILQL